MTRTVHRYGPHADQHAELVVEAGTASLPVAVVLHGGFWREPYDRRLMDPLCDDLARAGWAAWNVEYRRLPEGGWPETFMDVAAAIDALADVGGGLDLRRTVTIGHSAGGQLALWAAGRHRLRGDAPGAGPRVPVTHAVAQAGVTDLREAARLDLGGGVVRELLGPGWEDRLPLASPAELVPLGVPQLLVHGGADGVVPPSIARRYADRARAAGDDVTLVVEAGVGHFEHLDPDAGVWAHVRRWLDERAR